MSGWFCLSCACLQSGDNPFTPPRIHRPLGSPIGCGRRSLSDSVTYPGRCRPVLLSPCSSLPFIPALDPLLASDPVPPFPVTSVCVHGGSSVVSFSASQNALTSLAPHSVARSLLFESVGGVASSTSCHSASADLDFAGASLHLACHDSDFASLQLAPVSTSANAPVGSFDLRSEEYLIRHIESLESRIQLAKVDFSLEEIIRLSRLRDAAFQELQDIAIV